MSERFENVIKDFASLRDCVESVQQEFGEGQYLFRGERTDCYLTTPPMLERVRTDRMLPPKCRAVIECRVQQLHKDLQTMLDLEPDLAMGFLQHYEVPTDLLDLTSDPTVAAYFAAGGKVGSSGLFAALPWTVGTDPQIQDLRRHPKALRPRRQCAFTFSSKRFKNLKSDDCINGLGVQWYRFTLTEADKKIYRPNDDLLVAHTDPVAGVIQLLLDDYGKTNDWTAKWLADHVVAAPFITRIVSTDASGTLIVELVSALQAGMEFDETVERFNNHRVWSNTYRDTRGSGGLKNLRPRVR